MIKYLGSKRRLIRHILEIVASTPRVSTVLDLFSGSARVGAALKGAGYRVIACDSATYAAILARCHVQADREDLLDEATRLIRELNALPGRAGYVTEHYAIGARFFRRENAERIDAIREEIARKSLDPELEAVLIAALIEAADRVDSTVGTQMAYLKSWAPRAYNPLVLRVPELLPRARHGKSLAIHADAREIAASVEADLAYLDPPYNQHAYLANYHIWETLARWDHPPVYGIARKRADVRDRKSPFNSRTECLPALRAVLQSLRVHTIVLSYSNEGFIPFADLVAALRQLWGGEGELCVLGTRQRRYVGALIGIHDPSGRPVGQVSHLHNTEYLVVRTKARLAGLGLPLATMSEDALPFVMGSDPSSAHVVLGPSS